MPHSSGTPCVLWYKPYRFGGAPYRRRYGFRRGTIPFSRRILMIPTLSKDQLERQLSALRACQWVSESLAHRRHGQAAHLFLIPPPLHLHPSTIPRTSPGAPFLPPLLFFACPTCLNKKMPRRLYMPGVIHLTRWSGIPAWTFETATALSDICAEPHRGAGPLPRSAAPIRGDPTRPL